MWGGGAVHVYPCACIIGRCIIYQCPHVSAGVCTCMHRCWDRAGSSLIIGSTQDTMKSGSKSGSYLVGSLEQVLQVRSFCGLSTSAKQEQGILLGVFLCLHSPQREMIYIFLEQLK